MDMTKPSYLLPAIVAAAFALAPLPAAAQAPQGSQGAQGQTTQGGKAAQKKPSTKQTVDKSVESGTVPAKYRSSVPKEYQQYVPFAKPGQ
jgi:hypothetical protein